MSRVQVIFFKETDGSIPLRDWLDAVPKKAQAKCLARLKRLEDLGHELRRPEADYLRDGIYELRVRLGTVNYRMLYSFQGRIAAVVSHGLVKKNRVPAKDIEIAIERMTRFNKDPKTHAE